MPKPAVTAKVREREFGKHGLYARDSQTIMCKSCNVTVSWDRKDSCVKHIESEKHKRLSSLNVGVTKRQASIATVLYTCKKKKDAAYEFARDTTEAFIKANIPLEKVDDPNIRAWMAKYVEGAGDLPHARTLREKYVGELATARMELVKSKVEGKEIDILCDETTDKMGRCVFVVLFRMIVLCSVNILVGGVHFLESANTTNCIRLVLDSLKQYGIEYENVRSVTTDSARYMMTKYVEGLKLVFGENLLHIQCWAHNLNLVGNVWPQELQKLNDTVVKMKSLFLNTQKRKHLYMQFLEKQLGRRCPLYPIPVTTRWNSWFESVFYLSEYFTHIVEFSKTEETQEINNAGVAFLSSLSASEISEIHTQAMFVREHAKCLVDLITMLEGSSYPTAHILYGELNKLKASFENVKNGFFMDDTTAALNGCGAKKAAALKVTLTQTMIKASTELCALISSDPSKNLFENLTILDPKNIMLTDINPGLVTKLHRIPSMKSLDQEKLVSGYQELKECVEKQMKESVVDIIKCLNVVSVSQPEFAKKCEEAIWIPCSNVDSKRFLSTYNNVLTDQRTNLKEQNVATMAKFSFEDYDCNPKRAFLGVGPIEHSEA